MTTARIGWIGIGKMGLPMCKHLLVAGHRVGAFDPDRGRLEQVVAAGADRSESIAAAVADADVVFSSIPDDAALRAIVLGEDGILSAAKPGMIYVDTSTVSPRASAQVAAALAANRVEYVRSCVSGSTVSAETRQLTVMASGPEPVYRRVEPLLACFAAKQFYLGQAEEARIAKLVVNSMIANTATMLAEAITLGAKGGLGWQKMLDVIDASAVASPMVKYKIPALRQRDFTPMFTVPQIAKDLALIEEAAEASGTAMPLTAKSRELFAELMKGAERDEDFIAVVKLIERMAGNIKRYG